MLPPVRLGRIGRIYAYFVIAVVAICSSTRGDATIYSQDFSANPQWTTDQPNYFHLTGGALLAQPPSLIGGPDPSRYSYVATSLDPSQSFMLEWDEDILQSDNGSYLAFGLYGSDLNPSNLTPTGSSLISHSTLNLQLGNFGGQFLGLSMMAANRQPGGWETVTSGNSLYPQNTWLRTRLTYNAQLGIVSGTIEDQGTGKILLNLGQNNVSGHFSSDMVNLGFAKPPPALDHGVTAAAVTAALLDNVHLTQYTFGGLKLPTAPVTDRPDKIKLLAPNGSAGNVSFAFPLRSFNAVTLNTEAGTGVSWLSTPPPPYYDPNHDGTFCLDFGVLGIGEIVAAKAGQVVRVDPTKGTDSNPGPIVTVYDGSGYYSEYREFSLGSTLPRVGQHVGVGDALGILDSTDGQANEHLHFQIKYNPSWSTPGFDPT